MAGAGALLLLGGATGLVAGFLIGARRRRRTAAGAAPVAAPPAPRPPRPTLNPVVVLRGDDIAALDERDAQELADELRPHLHDVARQHGASEATLWRRVDGEEAPLQIVAWSGDGPPPDGASWGTPPERALVSWSAAEQMVGFERRDGEPRVAMCPVRFASGEPAGAIVLSAAERFSTDRDALRDWLPRHAAQVGRLVSLFSTRNEVARQSRFTRALLRIARDLQRAHEPGALEASLCDYAVEVTGGEFSMLLRWDATSRTGRVAAHSERTPILLREGSVTEGSVAGAACVEGSAAFWEDARFLAERGGLLRDDDGGVVAGSMAVLPMMRGPHAIGALLIGSSRPGVLRALEIRNGSVLSALAVNALEAAWELAETSRRSRTDALTGLWNRRHFDEQLDRVLAETDRFGGSCALVICDIDFFKKVNDTYGHDAGDVVLQRVSTVLHDGVRTVDICARLGGEELALLLPQTSLEGAVELAERLRLRIEALLVAHGGVTIRVTVSMGVATYTAGTQGKGTIFKRADERLYAAKHAGRNRVVGATI
ncbi:MAG: sensor domain-containing diguanylate cyclase [Gemmatimonadota bacterium]|nr:sensor domain-containing diguanylate cyclase [Gemmatimonadota bacterium]